MRMCSIYEIRTDRGKVRYSQKNLYQWHFVHHKHYEGLRGENPATNSLSYGTTHYRITNKQTNNNNNNIWNIQAPLPGYEASLGNRVPTFRDSMFLRNVGTRLSSDTASYSRRTGSSTTLPCKSQDLHMNLVYIFLHTTPTPTKLPLLCVCGRHNSLPGHTNHVSVLLRHVD